MRKICKQKWKQVGVTNSAANDGVGVYDQKKKTPLSFAVVLTIYS